ncbi:TIGR03960 family B12-binding radical SAM protein, partial [bacterium]|nr:TIGR03960 family B12-binding radical SAM protein [bacterium]
NLYFFWTIMINDSFLKNIDKKVTKPIRYVGGEHNIVFNKYKEAKLSWLLCYPGFYEVGMSNLGLKILYSILNNDDDISAERAFAVGEDMYSYMKENSIPLYSLETKKEAKNFDIIGITLQSEQTFGSVLHILDLADIPFYSSERDENYPLIIGGGPSIFNSEPIADFFDAILIGDGEEAILEISKVIIESKSLSKKEKLLKLSKIEGVYIPSFFEFEYDGAKISKRVALIENYTKVKKRLLSDMNSVVVPTEYITANTTLIHDRVGVEIQRGCTRGCRFCQAGMTYRPVRQRKPKEVKEALEKSLQTSGMESAGLLSLSAGDYGCIDPLLRDLLGEMEEINVSLSLPSLRTESITDEMIREVAKVRKSGFTLAPEAGTDRMRRVINKGNSEENLLESVERIFQAGWDHLKLYFMMGFPTETEEDIKSIMWLAKKCSSIARRYNRKARVDLSVNLLVPKPFTPFQWVGMPDYETYQTMRNTLYHMKNSSVSINIAYYKEAMHDGTISRADRRLSSVFVDYYWKNVDKKRVFDFFDLQDWEESIEKFGLKISDLIGEKDKNDILPFDHIDAGVSKLFLWNEYQKALNEETTDDCSLGDCQGCSLCDFSTVKNITFKKEEYQSLMNSSEKNSEDKKEQNIDLDEKSENSEYFPLQNRNEIEYTKSQQEALRRAKSRNFKYFASVKKVFPANMMSQLDFLQTLTRIFRRASIPISYTEGFNKRAYVGVYYPLSLGIESLDEAIEFFTTESIDLNDILNTLNKNSVDGVQFLDLYELENKKELSLNLNGFIYEVVLDSEKEENETSLEFIEKKLDKKEKSTLYYTENSNFSESAKLLVINPEQTFIRKEKEYKLIDSVESVERIGENIFNISIIKNNTFIAHPEEIIKAIWGENRGIKSILKLKNIFVS